MFDTPSSSFESGSPLVLDRPCGRCCTSCRRPTSPARSACVCLNSSDSLSAPLFASMPCVGLARHCNHMQRGSDTLVHVWGLLNNLRVVVYEVWVEAQRAAILKTCGCEGAEELPRDM